MNVLLFVTSMLIVLSVMTYGRMELFLSSSAIEGEFKRYVETLERAYINGKAASWYDGTRATKKGSQPARDPGSKNSSPRLNLALLTDPKLASQQPLAATQVYGWLKNLIHLLYGNQKFYQKAVQKDPAVVDRVIDSIIRLIGELPEEEQVKRNSDLMNLNLNDRDLQSLYYKMLKGCPPTAQVDKKDETPIAAPQIAVAEEDNDEAAAEDADDGGESLEYSVEGGYSSLLNYITYSKATKVRVYLASRDLLIAIFGDPKVADSIITARSQLYSAVNNGMTPAEASKQFQEQFQGSATDSLLDFRVSKTNPNQYLAPHLPKGS
jgi:hypothetical protein